MNKQSIADKFFEELNIAKYKDLKKIHNKWSYQTRNMNSNKNNKVTRRIYTPNLKMSKEKNHSYSANDTSSEDTSQQIMFERITKENAALKKEITELRNIVRSCQPTRTTEYVPTSNRFQILQNKTDSDPDINMDFQEASIEQHSIVSRGKRPVSQTDWNINTEKENSKTHRDELATAHEPLAQVHIEHPTNIKKYKPPSFYY